MKISSRLVSHVCSQYPWTHEFHSNPPISYVLPSGQASKLWFIVVSESHVHSHVHHVVGQANS